MDLLTFFAKRFNCALKILPLKFSGDTHDVYQNHESLVHRYIHSSILIILHVYLDNVSRHVCILIRSVFVRLLTVALQIAIF